MTLLSTTSQNNFLLFPFFIWCTQFYISIFRLPQGTIMKIRSSMTCRFYAIPATVFLDVVYLYMLLLVSLWLT